MRRASNQLKYFYKTIHLKNKIYPHFLIRNNTANKAAIFYFQKQSCSFSDFPSSFDKKIFDVVVPAMGDSISEGTVVECLKNPGDFVETDEVVVILETDKVSVDVRSPKSGYVVENLAKVDDIVTVGASLLKISSSDKDTKKSTSSDKKMHTAEKSSQSSDKNLEQLQSDNTKEVTIYVPAMGDSISEGTIVQWMKGPGDFVDIDEVIVVLETDKVSVDVRASEAGVIKKVLSKVDETIQVGAPLVVLSPGRSTRDNDIIQEKDLHVIPSKKETSFTSDKKATSIAPDRKLPPVDKEKKTEEKVSPIFTAASRGIRREKMNRMRLRIAERLKESQNTAASLTTFQECDMGNLMALRTKYKESFESKHGCKLGFMSAFVKASSAALIEVPGVNAMIDEKMKEIVYRDYVDMSVAVATPKGLVTPVLKNTESMSFADIEKKLAELAKRARDGTLSLEEMTGGNFTISNGGVFGSLMGTPILNTPQSGILGMHATKMRPVVYKGEIVARPMMYLALTYDHRLVDGREAVTCLKSIAEKIENPESLLLDL